ncbi:hypothetical protein PQ610_04290 [Tardisphaera miroshnichenkoae]
MSIKDKLRSAIEYLYSPDNSEGFWNAATVIAILVIAFLIGGGIYVLYYGYPFVVYTSTGQIYYIYPGSIQVGAEVIIIAVLLIMGAAGFYLIYRATTTVEDPEIYQQMLYIGVVLVFISFIALFAFAAAK